MAGISENISAWTTVVTINHIDVGNMTYFEDYEDFTLDYSKIGASAPCAYEQYSANFLPALYSTFFVLGFLGNILVPWVIMNGARVRNMTDVCLVNLALADLALVCTLPFLAHQERSQWVFGEGMCKMVLGVYYIAFISGIFFVTMMSIDRYLAIVHAVYAMRVRTRTYGMIASLCVWIAGVLISLPELMVLGTFSHRNTDNVSLVYCKTVYKDQANLRAFDVFKINVLGFLVPTCIMGFCYFRILGRLYSIRSSKRQAVRLVILVMVVFLFCWAPYNVLYFLKGLEICHVLSKCNVSKFIALGLQITEILAYFHCCLNPVLYAFVGEKFRRHLFRLLSRVPCLPCRLIKSWLTTASGSVYSVSSSMDERTSTV
ncbi:C-C chemokine receptor type 8-like [Denticeps clupeoides]|uniref:G-protein coupled receptors family 1 profile domain-containing protein n=1 Tax=Denticeps clupeoides TaxID=299321 RepID=A0AAY4C6B0_9TELE|nr:C-C chemokine receptor type 8-like [Denticeps clupeoides]